MAFGDIPTRTEATDGLAKYTFKVSGSTEQVELTSMNEIEINFNNYDATVPSGYFDPTNNNYARFGLDFIASKLYEDIFGKTFYTNGGASVGLLTDMNEQSFFRNVKLNADYHPVGYFGLEG